MTISIEESPTHTLTSEELENCYRLHQEMTDRLESQIAALPVPVPVRRMRRRDGKKTVVRVVLNREENAALMRRGIIPANLGTKKLTRRQKNMVSAIRTKQEWVKPTITPRVKAQANAVARRRSDSRLISA